MNAGEIQRVKRAVRQRDGYCCTICGITQAEHIERFGRGLEVHRNVPGSAYSVDGCQTLCRPCHYPLAKRTPGSPDFGKIGTRVLACIGLRPDTITRLDDTATRLGISRAATVEALVLQCADYLRPITMDSAGFPDGHRGKRGNGRRKPRTTPPVHPMIDPKSVHFDGRELRARLTGPAKRWNMIEPGTHYEDGFTVGHRKLGPIYVAEVDSDGKRCSIVALPDPADYDHLRRLDQRRQADDAERKAAFIRDHLNSRD